MPVTSINIKVSEDGIIYKSLPFVFRSDMPYLSWELPVGISQHKYCVEMKTREQRLRTDGSYGYGYYNSGLIVSSEPKHKISLSLDSNTWKGTIEIRIRVLNSSNLVLYCTHDYNAGAIYDFEPSPQYYLWDSTKDDLYCVRDISYSTFNTVSGLRIVWDNSDDDDDELFDRTMSYELQVCGSPLFDDGTYLVGTFEQEENGSVSSFYDYDVEEYNDALFFRVRGYDGLDYGDWSVVRAFIPYYNSVPTCEIISVNTNVSPRGEGEILVEFIVHDENNFYVNAFLEYSQGYVIPESNPELLERCALYGTNAVVPTNTIIRVYWLSARTIIDRIMSGVFIYLHAYDGLDTSSYDSYGPFDIDNIGIGFGVGGGSIDNIDFYISGRTIGIDRYYQIPNERIFTVDGEPIVDFDTTLLPNEDFVGSDYYSNPIEGFLKKNYYALYHGYDFLDDQRLSTELILDYRNESKYRILRELGYTDEEINLGLYDPELESLFSSFTQIYLDHGEFNIDYSREGDTYGIGMGLGRENEDVYYNLIKRPDIEPYINIHRPKVMGGYGIYVDGPGINNNSGDYGEYKSSPNGELWSNMYWLHPFHDPKVTDVRFYSSSGDIGDETISSSLLPYGERLWRRIALKIEISFPVIIANNDELKNDRYFFILNNKTEISGSLLEDTNVEYFEYPYNSFIIGEDVYYEVDEEKRDKILEVLNRLFDNDIFDQLSLDNFVADHENKKIVGYAYGKKSHRLKSFEVKRTENSCYEIFGMETIYQTQSYEDINLWGGGEGITSYRGFKDFAQRIEFLGGQIENEYLFEMPYESSYQYGDIIEEVVQETEPLFTCSIEDVNANGFHFKYSLDKYIKTGKVYVRLYHTEDCFPFEDPVLEYKNFIVVPDEVREGIYHRKKIKNKRGIPAETQTVTLSTGEIEIAYFEPGGDCLSHSPVDELDLSKGYNRIPARVWLPKICHKTIYVAEYVECDRAFIKPYFENNILGTSGPINKHSSINPAGSITSGYNLYLLGAYKPSPEQLEQGIDIPSYNYSSVVSVEQDGEYGRFSAHWLGYTQDETSGGCDLVFVDPWLIGFKGKVNVGHSFGYVPDTSLETYFKVSKDENAIDRHLSPLSYYVHEILRHPHLSPRLLGRVIKDYGIIADTSMALVNPEEVIKKPHMDMRLRGRFDLEQKYYFSGNPRDEHPAYATRPDIVYREDRPWRLNGFVQKLEELSTWGFKFLQSEWNTYNLLHWYGSQSKYNYAKIEASQRLEDGSFGDWFDVRTKSGILFEEYGWLIPYNKINIESELYDEEMFRLSKFPREWVTEQMIPVDWFGSSVSQSDYVDTLNQENFHFGETYRFRISSVNIIDGAVISPTISSNFTLDIDAASPPTIVSMSIDKWTKILTIRFRFDDIQGRKYDLSDFYYSIDNGDTWINNGFAYLEGNLKDLDSNMFGDKVISNYNLIIHEIRLDLNLLADVFDKPEEMDNYDYEGSLLVRLSAILSENKEGLLYPVFNFKMWSNELLKKAEDKIINIMGQKTRWCFVESVDENDEITSEWIYLEKGHEVMMPGELSIVEESIREIEEQFLFWYSSVRTYYYPSVDARIDYIISQSLKTDYRLFCFNEYVVYKDLTTDYDEYSALSDYKEEIKIESYLQDRALLYEFEDFVYRRNSTLSISFFGSNSLWDVFESWYQERIVVSVAESYSMFVSYYGFEEEYNTYLIEEEIVGDDYIGFIKNKKYDSLYNNYYELLNQYSNEKSVSRGVYIDSSYSLLYESWLLNPTDIDGKILSFDYLPITFDTIDYDDDKWVLFLEWAYENEEIETDAFINEFIDTKYNLARSNYLNQLSGGITIAQKYSSLVSKRLSLLNQLNDAYEEKNYYETRHRIRLIRQGFFSNGFLNNVPYKTGTEVNDAFRFRVESKPIRGNLMEMNEDTETPVYVPGETTTTISIGYETRFEIYFHFQMDFYDTFDSQDGLPFRDKVYQLSSEAGVNEEIIDIEGVEYSRIPGAIVAESGLKASPSHVYESTNPDTGYTMVTTADPYDLRFSGTYSLLKSELPGKLITDSLPSIYNNYEQLYYWRVAPYNIVERPVVECSFGESSNVVLLSDDGYTKRYKFDFLNRFHDGINDSYIGDLVTSYPYNINPIVRFSESVLSNFVWTLDCDGSFSSTNEAWLDHFNRGERWYHSSWINKNLIHRGEVQFITDRPRSVVEDEDGDIIFGETKYKISYIEDENNNFLSIWVPYNTRREKPCVVRDNENCEYYMFYHKPNSKKLVNGIIVDSNIIVFARAFNPMSFGEESRCFPLLCQDDINSVVANAISFENPWVVKDNGIYRMYFNVIFWNQGISAYEKKVYVCSSNDLSSWTTPELLLNFDECTDVMVYVEDDFYKLYCIKTKMFDVGGVETPYQCIFSSVSDTWDTFSEPVFIYGGDYQLSSPCFCSDRLYYSQKSAGLILSIGRTANNGGVSVDEFNCDYPTPDANNPRFEIGPSSDYQYCNPCVIEDYDLGNKTERMFFNLEDHPYLWQEGVLSMFGLSGSTSFYREKAIGTRYLEKHTWGSALIDDIKIGGVSVPFGEWSAGEDMVLSPYPLMCSKEGILLEIEFETNQTLVDDKVRVPIGLIDSSVECESIAEWIDYNNVSRTDAIISPEEVGEDELNADYSPMTFLINKELIDEYNDWRLGIPEGEFETENDYIIGFLVYSRYIGEYLQWSKRGPGIYRHRVALDKLSWTGDGE